MSFARVPFAPVFRVAARAVAVAALACVLPWQAAQAAQILVSSTGDAISPVGGCSLREAIINANTDSRAGSLECARGSGADVIVLPPDTLAVLGSETEESDPATGDFDITSDITILGGSGAFSVLDANYSGRIFDVQSGGRLTLDGLRVRRGSAGDEGASIRVNGGGELVGLYLVVSDSRLLPADGVSPVRGAGLYVADGGIATISRSEFGYNTASGPDAMGGGVACADGCTLNVDNTTFLFNSATSQGGGVFVADGGLAEFAFTTMGGNAALSGAGLQVDGDVSLFASVLAENGSGAAGDDIACSLASPGVALAGERAFAEYPAAACMTMANPTLDPAVLRDRAMLAPASLPAEVLYTFINSAYEGAPGRTLSLREAFYPYLSGQVPAADARCANLLDEHGRKRVPGTACDLGALQRALLSVWKMGVSAYDTAGAVQLYMNLGSPPATATRVLLQSAGGVGESCGPIGVPVDTDGDTVNDATGILVNYAAGETLKLFAIDPAEMFPSAALNRPNRVCYYSATVLDGGFAGATAGNLRVKVIGTSGIGSGFSNPAVGAYLEIGTVPVGAGGQRSLYLTPDVGDFNVTGISFVGLDWNRFEITVPAATETVLADAADFVYGTPVPVRSRLEGGTGFPVRCRGGQFGDFESEMVVHTDSPTWGDLHYGVRCTAAHLVTVAADRSRIDEFSTDHLRFTVSLDSPNALASDIRVNLAELAGSATSGVDYPAFAGLLTFAPGDQHKVVTVDIVNDNDVENDESVGAAISLAAPVAEYVRLGGGTAAWATIDDEDQLSRELTVTLNSLPDPLVSGPGVLLPMSVTVTNTGNDRLNGVAVELTVQQPMWIRSFALFGANCGLDNGRRKATCYLPFELVPGQSVEVFGRILTAEMNEAPALDVRGMITAKAIAGGVGSTSMVTGTDQAQLLIDAPALNASLGGAAWPGMYGILLFASLLSLRRARLFAGWKARPRV